MKITKNFHLKELIISSTAERLGIENKPNGEQLVSLSILTQAILQPIRDEFGVVSISSGLRVPDLNKAIGGSKDSSHCKGEAADFECYSVSNYDLCSWIIAKLKFDQLILEFYTRNDPQSGWVHCSYKRDGSNRNQVMTAIKKGKGKTDYLMGLNQ